MQNKPASSLKKTEAILSHAEQDSIFKKEPGGSGRIDQDSLIMRATNSSHRMGQFVLLRRAKSLVEVLPYLRFMHANSEDSKYEDQKKNTMGSN